MLEQLKKEWKIQRGDIYGLVGGTCGAFVFGMVLVFIILKLDDDPNKTYFCMGTLMAVVGAAVIMLVMRGVTYPMSLQVAISMGRTRREYIFAYLVMSVLLAAVCVAVVWALYAFESWLYPMLYPICVAAGISA